jgi:hypothetical protein
MGKSKGQCLVVHYVIECFVPYISQKRRKLMTRVTRPPLSVCLNGAFGQI